MDTTDALRVLNESLSALCNDFNLGAVTPLMEADIAAYLYRAMIKSGCSQRMVYLETRIKGRHARSRRPDLVVGEIDCGAGCVEPVLICEIKAFQRWGMTDQQMNRRFEHVLESDLVSLGQMRDYLDQGRVQILADFIYSSRRPGYLSGHSAGHRRIDLVAERAAEVSAALVWIHPLNSERVGPDWVVPIGTNQ